MARNSPIDDDEPSAPLPDRTRVEPSPFAEGGAADLPRARSNGSRRRAPSPQPSSSIIVDEALDASSSPRRPSGRRPKAAAPEPDYDSDDPSIPDAPRDDSNATRIAPAPSERRPAARAPQDENATSAGPPVSVEVLAGPDRGVRLPIRGGRMIVGRGDGCDLKLTDTSVSRRHLELTAGPGGIVLRDLGSGNGTRVNGETQVETVLEHGAEVALGETVFKVIDELKRHEEERAARKAPPPRRPPPRAAEEEPAAEEDPEDVEIERRQATGRLEPIPSRHLPPREQPGLLARFAGLPKPMKLLILGGTGVVLLIAVLALFTPPKKTAPAEPPQVKKQRQFDELMQQANNLYRERKYKEAQETYLQANEAMESPKAADAAQRCERNLEAKRTLSDAQALAARGEFDRAIALVKELPEGDTEYADEAKEKAKEWAKGKVQADLEKVKAAAEAGDFEGAMQLVASLPYEHQEPQRRMLAEQEKTWKADAASRQRQAAATAARQRAAAAQRLRQEVDDAVAPIVRKMEQGNFDGAVRECERVAESARSPAVAKKVQLMKSRIPSFGQAYNEGMSRFHGGAYEQAAGSLLRAFKLLEDMDLETKLDKTLRDKAGQTLVAKGRAAVARRDFGAGAKAYKDALRLNPGSTQATEGLRVIRAAAQEVYSEGYAIMGRDPDAARKRFRDVLEMVPAGDELAKKAQMRLDSMER